ncbi:MAG: inositol monophosphatase family protein, partial [Bacillota bacterium]
TAQGLGSFHKDATGKVMKLQVSATTDLKQVRLVMSSSHGCQEMDDLITKYQFDNFVKMGSSLKGCLVAKGEAEIYYRHNPTMEWDTAAMQCIAEEAGAIFRQMDGTEMTYNRENSLNDKGFYIINSKENQLV